MSLQENQPVGIDLTRADFATEALNLLVQLRSAIGEEIFAGLDPDFGSGVPQKAFMNLKSVHIRMGSVIQDLRRTITAQVEYTVLA